MCFVYEDMERRSKRFVTEDLSDEHAQEFINSHESDEEIDYNSDDSILDPTFVPDAIERDESLDAAVNDMVAAESTNAYIDAASVDLSALDITAIENPIASSTLRKHFGPLEYDVIDDIDLLSSGEELVDVPVIHGEVADLPPGYEIIAEGPEPSTSCARTSSHKPKKRLRSPLPTIETTGPSITPGSGGFTGTGKFITLVLFT